MFVAIGIMCGMTGGIAGSVDGCVLASRLTENLEGCNVVLESMLEDGEELLADENFMNRFPNANLHSLVCVPVGE